MHDRRRRPSAGRARASSWHALVWRSQALVAEREQKRAVHCILADLASRAGAGGAGAGPAGVVGSVRFAGGGGGARGFFGGGGGARGFFGGGGGARGFFGGDGGARGFFGGDGERGASVAMPGCRDDDGRSGQLGVATAARGLPGGVQLSFPLDLPAPPRLRELSGWGGAAGGLWHQGDDGRRPSSRPAPRGCPPARHQPRPDQLRHGGRVRVGVGRRSPAAGDGEGGGLRPARGRVRGDQPDRAAAGVRAPPPVVRTEPLLLVEGKLERFAAAGGAINILVAKVDSISAPDRIVAHVKDFSLLDEQVRTRRAERSARPRPPTTSGLSRRR